MYQKKHSIYRVQYNHGLGNLCPSRNVSPTDNWGGGGTNITDLLSHQKMGLRYLEKTFASNYASQLWREN